MSGSAVLGGAFGFSRASAAAQDEPAPERLGFSIVQGGATAAVAAGVGAFVYGNASLRAKQHANSKVVQMVMPQEPPLAGCSQRRFELLCGSVGFGICRCSLSC